MVVSIGSNIFMVEINCVYIECELGVMHACGSLHEEFTPPPPNGMSYLDIIRL